MKDGSSETFDTTKSLAERWQVSERTVRRLIEKGDIKAHRIGDQIRISQEDRDAYERSQRS